MPDEKILKLAPVTVLETITRLDLSSDRVLNAALAAGLTSCVVIGHDKSGDFYFGSTSPDGGSVIWDLEMAKKKLLEVTL